MALYTVHSRGEPENDAIFVRDGFSTAAFVLSIAWALWNRMWIVAAGLAAVMMMITAAGNWLTLPEGATSLISLAASVLFGLEAQNLRRWSLARRGFAEIAIVPGSDQEEAELRFFHERTMDTPAASRHDARPIRALTAEHDPLGLFHPAG